MSCRTPALRVRVDPACCTRPLRPCGMAGENKRGVDPDEGQTPRAFFYSVGKASQEAKPVRDLEVVVETERKVV